MAGQIHLVLLVSPEGQESRLTGLGMAGGSLHAFSSTCRRVGSLLLSPF